VAWAANLVWAIAGALWSPCVGPTLGAASLLAAQGRDLGHVALTMVAFGLGAALPLLLLGIVSRETLRRWRTERLPRQKRKDRDGLILIVTGAMVLTGLDKMFEAALVDVSPAWLTSLTTRI